MINRLTLFWIDISVPKHKKMITSLVWFLFLAKYQKFLVFAFVPWTGSKSWLWPRSSSDQNQRQPSGFFPSVRNVTEAHLGKFSKLYNAVILTLFFLFLRNILFLVIAFLLFLFLFSETNPAAVAETLLCGLRSGEHQREYSSHSFWPKPLMSSRLTGTNSSRSSAAQQMAFLQRSRSHDWDPGLSGAKVCQCRSGFHAPGNLRLGEQTYHFPECQDLSALVN